MVVLSYEKGDWTGNWFYVKVEISLFFQLFGVSDISVYVWASLFHIHVCSIWFLWIHCILFFCLFFFPWSTVSTSIGKLYTLSWVHSGGTIPTHRLMSMWGFPYLYQCKVFYKEKNWFLDLISKIKMLDIQSSFQKIKYPRSLNVHQPHVLV